jgi:hypothetical protein
MRPIAAAVTPLPTELTTPPVQKIYFGILYLVLVRMIVSCHKRERGGYDLAATSPPTLLLDKFQEL